jgi:predicted MFS family arabinose efflux permease
MAPLNQLKQPHLILVKLTFSKALEAFKVKQVVGSMIVTVFVIMGIFALYGEAEEAGYRGWFGPLWLIRDFLGATVLTFGLLILCGIIITGVTRWRNKRKGKC